MTIICQLLERKLAEQRWVKLLKAALLCDSSPHLVSGHVTRIPIPKAKHCSVYDTFPPTFSYENFCNLESLQECYSQHSYTHHLDCKTLMFYFSGFIIYLSSHQTIAFLSISKLQMLWYYFFNILYKYFQIYIKGEHPPRIFNSF